jgi:hypothetical protein
MPIYKCSLCDKQYKNSSTFTRHTAVCKFIQISSKDRNLTTEYVEKNPSLEDVYKLFVNLCVENANLKRRVDTLERNNYMNKKKTIHDYLIMLPKDIIPYSVWINQLVVREENLNTLFSSNLIECMKSVLDAFLDEKAPLRAFSQKQYIIYILENEKWNPISISEFSNLISVLSHRILKKYLEWKNINKELIETNEKMHELNIQYMQKANGFGKSQDQRCTEIKKWIFTKIQKSLKSVVE